MTQCLTERAGQVTPAPIQGQTLRVVPILGPSSDQPPYDLLRADNLSQIQVTEVSESGSVPTLQVHNALDVRVFLMDGQELVGAKQNRILNTDVLVPAQSQIQIPVSCVEQGRWHRQSVQFQPGKAASHRTRSGKARRVYESLREHRGHDANQREVWEEVRCSLEYSDAGDSPTAALADAYARREQQLSEMRQTLELSSEAVGIAVFHGSRFMGLDLFDRHRTLAYFWESLIDSYAIDVLATPVDPAELADNTESWAVQHLLDSAVEANWEPFNSPGEGMDWRMENPELTGAALVWEERVVIHLQLFPRQPQVQPDWRPRIRRPYVRRPTIE